MFHSNIPSVQLLFKTTDPNTHFKPAGIRMKFHVDSIYLSVTTQVNMAALHGSLILSQRMFV